MQRAGNRRYYRPADVDLARRIHRLLNRRATPSAACRKLLRERGSDDRQAMPIVREPYRIAETPQLTVETARSRRSRRGVDVFRLIALRNRLADALED